MPITPFPYRILSRPDPSAPDDRTPSRPAPVPTPLPPTVPVACEPLESRTLLSGAGPSAREQQMLELINRMRMRPAEELPTLLRSTDLDIKGALAFFGVNRTVLASQWKRLAPAPPLAWNDALARAASGHNQKMLANDRQSHQLPGEGTLAQRTAAAGYADASFVGENIFAYMQSVEHGHAGFAIDWGNEPNGIQDPAGHRDNLMAQVYREVGLSITDSRPGRTVGPLLVTQNFGARRSQGNPFVMGAAYEDRNRDNNYTPGEGLGEVTVVATGPAGTFSTRTWASGGYQFQLPPGTYSLGASGGNLKGFASIGNVVVGRDNVKRDFPRALFKADAGGPSARLTAASVGASLGGLATHTFGVTYSDNAAIDLRTLSTGDVRVTGPGGFSAVAQLVSTDRGPSAAQAQPGAAPPTAPTASNAVTATYRFTAPGGFFDSADNGTYTVGLEPGQVADTNGYVAAARALGTFAVAVPCAVLTPNGILVVNGTAGGDRVTLARSGPAGASLVARVNATARTFSYAAVRRVYVAGLAGNDFIDVGRNIMASVIDGGEGHDTLYGTDAADTLQGFTGNDVLFGQGGNDLFINLRGGADTIDGGSGTDRAARDPNDLLRSIEA